MLRSGIAIALLCLLGACGFQLQGAFQPPSGMQLTYIDAVEEYSLFSRAIEAELRAAGVELTDSPSEATAILTISFDETDQRVLSVSARNVPTEYEVFYTIGYRLDEGTTNLLPEQSLTLTRDYTYDSTLVLGKEREEELLREAIVNDLVRVVMKQLSTL